MTEKKQKQPTWTDVKKVLTQMSTEELIATINDLYKLRKENKLFLHTRYRLVEASLDDYQEKIANSVNPLKAKKISFKTAKQAISDYKKATGDPEGVTELMVFYCEECARSIKRVGVWEEYAAGTINIWFDTLKHIQDLPRPQYDQLWERLATAQRLMGHAPWGVTDYIDHYMYQFSPEREDEEEEIANSAPPEDMP